MPSTRRFPGRTIPILFAALLPLLASTAVRAAPSSSTPIVKTDSGPVQGIVSGKVDEYLGIPFAAPPVGPLRWMPPQPPAPWKRTLSAVKFGPICAQASRGVFASPSTNEDCLYLNVYAPGHAAKTGKKAVMVWFYGGGLFSGESNDYDGTKLARRGDVIVVTVNFRVGVLGFLSLPSLDHEGHTYANYGMMDQQAALRWVQRNIAQFGGDPANVTIFGQSGGATAVMANLVSPTAAGLFQRAILESGTHPEIYTAAEATKVGQAFARSAGCPDGNAACLHAVPVQKILANQGVVLKSFVNHLPAIDGTVMTETGFHAFRSGHFNKVPIMNGLVYDEQAFFLPEQLFGKGPLTAAQYKAYAETYGAKAGALLARYPLSNYPSPSLAEIAMAQGAKSCMARQLDRSWSQHTTVYSYLFQDRTAPSYLPKASYPMGAYHTSELQFLFPLFHGGQGTPHALSPSEEKLSDIMVDYWTNFAKTGNPNQPKRGLPAWRPYAAVADNVQLLGLDTVAAADGYGKVNDCGLWDSVVDYR